MRKCVFMRSHRRYPIFPALGVRACLYARILFPPRRRLPRRVLPRPFLCLPYPIPAGISPPLSAPSARCIEYELSNLRAYVIQEPRDTRAFSDGSSILILYRLDRRLIRIRSPLVRLGAYARAELRIRTHCF